MAINYQFDVINPFQAALQGYGAGAQILQQERAAAQQARQAQMQEAQFAQQGQLFGIQMQEAQLRAQQAQKQMRDAEEMKTLYAEYNDIMDQVRETNDPSLILSSGIIDRLAPVNAQMAEYSEGRFQQMTDAAKKAAHQNVMAPAVAGMMGNYDEQKALLQTQYDALINSGKNQEAAQVKILIDQLGNPQTRDLVTKTLLGRAIDLDDKATSEQILTISTTVKLPLEVQKIQSELAASAAAANGVPKPEDRMKAETDLRKEYTTAAKGYNETRTFFSQLLGAAQQKSSAGDTALITLFRKVLDPTSVVRESEFAQTAEGGGILQRVEAAGAGLVSGQKLTDAQRQDIINTAQEFMNAANAFERNRRKDFDYLINSYNLDPKAIYGSQPVGEVYKPGAAQNVPDYINMTMDQLKGVNTFGLTFDQAKAYNEALLYKIQQLKGAK